jgi:hypothetical protein
MHLAGQIAQLAEILQLLMKTFVIAGGFLARTARGDGECFLDLCDDFLRAGPCLGSSSVLARIINWRRRIPGGYRTPAISHKLTGKS